MEQLKAVSYSRVSSQQQVKKEGLTVLGSLNEQKEAAINACNRNDWIYIRDYKEAGISAEKDNPDIIADDNITSRPALQELIKDAEAGKFDIVIFRHSDRIARLQHIYLSVAYNLETLFRVQLYNLSNPGHIVPKKDFRPARDNSLAIIRTIEGLQGQMEQNDRVMKLSAGRKRQVEAGRFIFTPPYGYKIDFIVKDGKFLERVPVPDEIEHQILQYIFNLALEGSTSRQIAKQLTVVGYKARSGKPWSANSIDKILRNPFYAGKLQYGRLKSLQGGKRETNKEQASILLVSHNYGNILTFEQFQELSYQRQERLTNSSPKAIASPNPLAGILKCGYCGFSMFLTTSKDRTKKYTYYNYRCSKHAKNSISCQLNLTPVDLMLSEAYKEIDNYLETTGNGYNKLLTPVSSSNSPISLFNQLQANIELIRSNIEQSKEDVYLMYKDKNRGIISEQQYLDFSKKASLEQDKLNEQLTSLENEQLKIRSRAANLEQLSTTLQTWRELRDNLKALHFSQWPEAYQQACKIIFNHCFIRASVVSRYDRISKEWGLETSFVTYWNSVM